MATGQQGEVEVDASHGHAGPVEPAQNPPEPRRQYPPPSTTSNSPSQPDSPTYADRSSSSSLVEEGSGVESSHKKTLANRLKLAVGLSNKSSDFTLDFQVPEITRSVDEYDRGYCKVAAFEDCDPNFLIYRKFGWLHNRVLLHLQDQLQDLEDQLEMLDKWEVLTGNPAKLVYRRIDEEDPDSERKKLLKEINDKLAEYDAVLLRLQKKQAIRKPTKRNQNSLYNLIDTSESMLSDEAKWIRQSDDLMALARDAEYGWFNAALEDTLRWLSPKLTLAFLRTRNQHKKTGTEKHLSLISPERLDILLRIVLTILAAILMLIPVLVLFELQPDDPGQVRHRAKFQLLTIFVFTMVFSASCSIFTKARRQEVFTATAAYCAVLVVFLGNTLSAMVNSSDSPPSAL